MKEECHYPQFNSAQDLKPRIFRSIFKSLAPVQAPIATAAGLLTSFEACPKRCDKAAHKKIKCRSPEGLKTGSIPSLMAS